MVCHYDEMQTTRSVLNLFYNCTIIITENLKLTRRLETTPAAAAMVTPMRCHERKNEYLSSSLHSSRVKLHIS